MICFQISIFEPLKTTLCLLTFFVLLLWFAFKLVSLNHWKQRCACWPSSSCCCDLLSNLYLWTIENNARRRFNWTYWVVICFQISIFEPLKTTLNVRVHCQRALWFAFKLVSLNHWKQLSDGKAGGASRCDLLSN